MVIRLTIVSFLVLAMIATKEATDNIKSHAGLEQRLRSIRKFERDTHESFTSPSSIAPLEKNFYYENITPQPTEL